MRMACTMAPERGGTDLLLAALARRLMAQGVRLAGTVQINTEPQDTGPYDMDVRILPDGARIRISQSLGRGARGCRLDPAALETAVGLVEAELARGADCLIVNKFGKHEAEGRGFRPVIAEALGLGIPVLVGLNTLNRQAFVDFAGEVACELPPDLPTLEAWLRPAAAIGHQQA